MPTPKLEFPPRVREFLATTIRSTGGHEVYFLGRVEWVSDGLARVEEVDVFARGNQRSTPAIIEGAESWDVAIHNHPGGDLTPSDADVAIAGELGNREVGFVIIDDTATRHALVVPPFRKVGETPVDPAAVRDVFVEGGVLAAHFDRQGSEHFETRQGQIDMALEVTRALNERGVVALEAGTGVGKSFAYLVPAIFWAVANKKRVVVSTNTIALQEQLVQKDLPFLERTLPVKFKYALIKGRGNYACLRKAAEARTDATTLFDDDASAGALSDLLEWVDRTSDGSLADLGVQPREEVWEKVMSETDKSLGVNCEFYDRCFYFTAKRAAFKADILVVNHHLFFADLALRKETQNFQWNLILPGYDRVVFDEAHHLEDVASHHLGVRFSSDGLRNRFSRLVSPRDSKRGTLPFLARKLRLEGDALTADSIENHAVPVVPEVAERIDGHVRTIVRLAEAEALGARQGVEAPAQSFHVRLTGDRRGRRFRSAVAAQLEKVQTELRLLARVTAGAIERLKTSPKLSVDRRQSLLLDLTSLAGRLDRLLASVAFFADQEDETHVRWIDVQPPRRASRDARVTFATSPVRVADELREAVFKPLRTVVMTSATLSVEGTVDFVGSRVGFDSLGPERFRFTEFPSPFDFERQARTLVPTDFPDPKSPQFEARVASVVTDVARILGGRTFVLFTSYALLRQVEQRVRGELETAGIELLCQGRENRTELLRRFRSGPRHVLFGTDSFWEGVDVRGRALECVIITRLPFRVPTEPLQLARVEDLEKRGLKSFPEFTVPQAVLKFKQGYGRLIRSSSDRGVVVVLDRRIITQRYGETFLRSLPPARLVRAPTREIVRVVKEYFAGEPND